jgi:hypothetical protein
MGRLENEIKSLWEEKTESETFGPNPDADEDFIPAKLATHEPDEEVLISITL